MGAWIGRPAARWLAVDRSDLLAQAGAVVGFIFVAGSWLYLRPIMGGPLWLGVAASVIVILLAGSFAALLWTDVWPLRLLTVMALITLSEFTAGVDYRQDSESMLLAHSLVMAASSTLVLSLRNSWRSALFTGFLAVLVFGHTLTASLVHQLGPATMLMVAGAWSLMLAIRCTAPKALDAFWNDQSVLTESLAAQAVARDTIDASSTNARLMHDTILRSLTLLARGGAGADPDRLREMLTPEKFDAGDLRSRVDPAAALGRTPGGTEGSFSTLGAVAVVEPSTTGEVATLLADRARLHGRYGLAIEVFGEAGPLPPEIQSALTDAAEECMVNAARHSGTDRVDVLVSRSGSLVSVLISDAGLGFDPDAIPPGRFGVRHSVVERMGRVGGSAKVLSAPGRGTTVVLEAEA